MLPFVEDDTASALLAYVANDDVEALTSALRPIPGCELALLPHEAMVLTRDDPNGERQRVQTAPRAAIEVLLRGLKAVGSWSSFSTYAIVAGVLSWVALWQSSNFLLLGAVLVAPYPSPALNAALGTATGDRRLFGRSAVRYAAALALGIAAAAACATATQLDVVTDLMRSTSYVSATSALLPLCAGIAGGLYLSQSEESSLISAVAAGVLVTAALVPPVGVVGMSLTLGEWAMAKRAAFLLCLQVVAINVTAPLALWAYGVRPGVAWLERGRQMTASLLWSGTLVVLAGLLVWQFTTVPALLRPTLALEAQALVHDAAPGFDEVDVISADFRFLAARPQQPGLLLGTLYVRPTQPRATGAALREHVQRRVQELLTAHDNAAIPLVTVTVVEPSAAGTSPPVPGGNGPR